jgi:hypothetical protein
LKCEKCGFVSFDHNLSCPSCNRDLTVTRGKMGLFYAPPGEDLEAFFAGGSNRAGGGATSASTEDTGAFTDEDLEFSLDD